MLRQVPVMSGRQTPVASGKQVKSRIGKAAGKKRVKKRVKNRVKNRGKSSREAAGKKSGDKAAWEKPPAEKRAKKLQGERQVNRDERFCSAEHFMLHGKRRKISDAAQNCQEK